MAKHNLNKTENGKIKKQNVSAPIYLNVLLVDDEKEILLAIKRVMRNSHFNFFTAANGDEAKRVLSSNPIHILLTDLRMPGISGEELLKYTAESKPGVCRMALSGNADLTSIKQAVNDGNIDAYLEKPWNNDELKQVFVKARKSVLKRYSKTTLMRNMVKEKDALSQKNEQLKHLVAGFKEEILKIEANHSNEKKVAIQMLLDLLSVYPSIDKRFALDVSELAVKIGQQLGFDNAELETLDLAGKFCEIGLVGVDSAICKKPLNKLTYQQKDIYLDQIKHAGRLLSSKYGLDDVKKAVINQFSRIKKITGEINPIPISAQILAIARDIRMLEAGRLTGRKEEQRYIKTYLQKHAGTKYSSVILDVLFKNEQFLEESRTGSYITVDMLKPGMILEKNLYSSNFLLIYPKGYVLSEKAITTLKRVEANSGMLMNLQVAEMDENAA